MRPDILNPLFAEIDVLKGVGATLAKPLARLGIARVVDLLFHLPTGMIERRAVERLDVADAGRTAPFASMPPMRAATWSASSSSVATPAGRARSCRCAVPL